MRGNVTGRVAVAASLVLLTGCTGAVAASPEDIIVAGTIRPTEDCSDWRLVEDSGHTPRGVASVEAVDGKVVIHFDEAAQSVVTFVATPDESLAALGHTVGASVGLDRAELTVEPTLDCAAIGEWANVWFYGVLAK